MKSFYEFLEDLINAGNKELAQKMWRQRQLEATQAARNHALARNGDKVTEIIEHLNGGQKTAETYNEALERIRRQSKMGIEEARKALFNETNYTPKNYQQKKLLYSKMFQSLGFSAKKATVDLQADKMRRLERFARELKSNPGYRWVKTPAASEVSGLEQLLFKFKEKAYWRQVPISTAPTLGGCITYVLQMFGVRSLAISALVSSMITGVLEIIFGAVIAAVALGACVAVVQELSEELNRWKAKAATADKRLEEIEANLLFLGADVMGIKYAPNADTEFLGSLLFCKLLGSAIQKASEKVPAIAEMVRATQRNNPNSFIAQITTNYHKLTGTGLTAMQYKTYTLYDGTSAARGSDCITFVSYRAKDRILYIGFNDRRKSVYGYRNVPIDVVREFMRAPANANSIGLVFNRRIRPVFKVYQRFVSKEAIQEEEHRTGVAKTIGIIDNPIVVGSPEARQGVFPADWEPSIGKIAPDLLQNKDLIRALYTIYGGNLYIDDNGRMYHKREG